MVVATLVAVFVTPALSIGAPLTASSALNSWRGGRLLKWASTLERRFDKEYFAFGKARADLRYRTQILVVDSDDGVRARVCEAVLDRLCEQGIDADVDAMTSYVDASLLRRPPKALCDAGAALGLSRLPLEAGSRQLRATDLLTTSRWDVVVCTELAVLERVRSFARAANAIDRGGASLSSLDGWADERLLLQWASHLSGVGTDAKVLCLTDFLQASVPPAPCSQLPDELRRLVQRREARDTDAVADQIERTMVDLPCKRGLDDDDGIGQGCCGSNELIGAATVCCSGLLAFLEATMREHAKSFFLRDLAANLPALEHRNNLEGATSAGTSAAEQGEWRAPSWEEACAAMSFEHAVPGGISDQARRTLFEEHVRSLHRRHAATESAAGSGSPIRVDVSDLGLTMDDLQGPLGNF